MPPLTPADPFVKTKPFMLDPDPRQPVSDPSITSTGSIAAVKVGIDPSHQLLLLLDILHRTNRKYVLD